MIFLDVFRKLNALNRNLNVLVLTNRKHQAERSLRDLGLLQAIAKNKCYKVNKLNVYMLDSRNMRENLYGLTIDYVVTDYDDFNVGKDIFGTKKVKIFSYKEIKGNHNFKSKPYKDMFYLWEV